MAEPSVPQGLKNQAEIAILPYVLYNCVIPAKNTIRGENTMNKTELIAAMAETSGLSKKDCDAADRKSTRLNSSHPNPSRMPSSA